MGREIVTGRGGPGTVGPPQPDMCLRLTSTNANTLPARNATDT